MILDLENEPNSAVDLEAEVELEVQQTLPTAFSVRCPESASWLVRRIVAARQYSVRVRIWAELERHRAEAEERRLLYLFEGQLRAWAETEIAKLNGRRKSIALPGGTVGFRHSPIRVALQDEDAVIRWAKQQCPQAVVVVERLLKTPINEHFERTGEVPPGVAVLPAESKLYIR